jgi:hypothetical protein
LFGILAGLGRNESAYGGRVLGHNIPAIRGRPDEEGTYSGLDRPAAYGLRFLCNSMATASTSTGPPMMRGFLNLLNRTDEVNRTSVCYVRPARRRHSRGPMCPVLGFRTDFRKDRKASMPRMLARKFPAFFAAIVPFQISRQKVSSSATVDCASGLGSMDSANSRTAAIPASNISSGVTCLAFPLAASTVTPPRNCNHQSRNTSITSSLLRLARWFKVLPRGQGGSHAQTLVRPGSTKLQRSRQCSR